MNMYRVFFYTGPLYIIFLWIVQMFPHCLFSASTLCWTPTLTLWFHHWKTLISVCFKTQPEFLTPQQVSNEKSKLKLQIIHTEIIKIIKSNILRCLWGLSESVYPHQKNDVHTKGKKSFSPCKNRPSLIRILISYWYCYDFPLTGIYFVHICICITG